MAQKSQNVFGSMPSDPLDIYVLYPLSSIPGFACMPNGNRLVGSSQRTKFLCTVFVLCMKGGICTCMPLTSTPTLHPPFEMSGYGPV